MSTTTDTVDMLDPALIADPYTGFARVREEGPVRAARGPDGSDVWLVTRQDDVRAVLADHRVVTDPTVVPGSTTDARIRMMRQIGVPEELLPYLVHTILDVDGMDHTRIRKLVSRAFTVRRVAELRPRVEEITGGLLDRLTDPAELIEEFAYPLPITVICELVGVPDDDRPDWRRWGSALVSMNPEAIPTAMREMIAHCHDLAGRRRVEPRDDLLSGLVSAVDEHGDRLTDAEIVTMLLTLVFAGHETTAHLIGNGALALMTHRDQLDLLLADPSLWPGAVHELMRFCAPILITKVRYATEDMTVGGVPIAVGEALQPVLVSANRDPRVYPGPDLLDVTRRPSGRGDGHIGFGHGAHYCLGAALARQEGEVALRALFERFPAATPVGDPQWMPLPGSRRLAALPVRLG